jgi:hypothetical protein
LETFTEPREFVKNTRYSRDREAALAALDPASVDSPMVDLVSGFNALPHAFTLQCCYGHFVLAPGEDEHTFDPVPTDHQGPVRYRIAYVAFCLENSPRGRALCRSLSRVPEIDPGFIQFGSANWFWERWANSYVLQVEPVAYRRRDEAELSYAEALHVQSIRDAFFARLREVLAAERGEGGVGIDVDGSGLRP